MKKYLTISNILSLFVAFVFVQSFYFKLTGAPETVYIFTQVGNWMQDSLSLETIGQNFVKYGRFITAVFEALSVIFLFSKLRILGGLLALGTMSGAIFFHLFTPLGIKMPAYENGVQIGDDSGLLFALACMCWVSAVFIIIMSFKKMMSNK